MKPLSIRNRVLLAALLPVALFAAMLATFFLVGRIDDLEAAHRQRAWSPAGQAAAASDYGLFSGTRLLTQPIYESTLSLDKVLSRERELMLAGILTTLAGLLFGGVLAVRLSRGVIEPIVEVCDVVERIAQGDLSARVAVLSGSSLRQLEEGVNDMATRIESGREELRLRIAEATAELRVKKEEAELATLAKSRFLAAASHDLRQPMHALDMFMGRLMHLPHDDETRHLIGRVDASVHALQNLLDALLDISRLEAGVLRAQPRHFPAGELFERLRGDLGATAEDKGLALRFRPGDLWLTSDPILLHRILLNLVSNALRYTLRGGVLVACRRRGESVRIEVWDTGIGIPPESQAEIFKEFVQLANPERDRNNGLGLGLTIVDRTARLLGHPLSLISHPGRGSRFMLEVPAGLRVPISTPAPLARGQFEGVRLLVIDDDALARQGLVVLLESWGCRVSAAEDSARALKTVQRDGPPDLIACDYRLRHGENGIDALRLLRSRTGLDVPAFLISGNTDPELMKRADAAGIALLHKPVRPARLRALMHQLILGNTDDAAA